MALYLGGEKVKLHLGATPCCLEVIAHPPIIKTILLSSDRFALKDSKGRSLILRKNVTYYRTLESAIAAANSGAIGTSSDASKHNATAATYIKNGQPYVQLMKDTTEEATLHTTVNMTIDLDGHTLTVGDTYGIQVDGGTLTIDGRTAGSKIVQNRANNAVCIYVYGGNVVANGGEYEISAESGSVAAFYCRSNTTATLANCTTISSGDNARVYGVAIHEDAAATISGCDITATSKLYAYGATIKGDTYICNSNIKAYSNYISDLGVGYDASATGVMQGAGVLTMEDCYVYGLNSGLQSSDGTLYVNGGIYESYGHGGIYFTSTGENAYVRNATLRDCDPPEGYEIASGRCGAGFYIGSDSDVTVYMDNCDIHGLEELTRGAFTMRSTHAERNNSLYISNSRIAEGAVIRIDESHKLYIGRGNNFSAESTIFRSENGAIGMVIATEDVYIMNALT